MGPRLGVAALLSATALCAQAPPAAAPDSTSAYFPVLAYWGGLRYDGNGVDLLGLEVMEVRPERLGTRIRIGTWREAAASSDLLIETEVGPVLAVPLVRRLTLVPAGGFLTLIGNGIAWGVQGNVGILVEPVDRLLLHASAGRRWYRLDGRFVELGTWTVAAGWRL